MNYVVTRPEGLSAQLVGSLRRQAGELAAQDAEYWQALEYNDLLTDVAQLIETGIVPDSAEARTMLAGRLKGLSLSYSVRSLDRWACYSAAEWSRMTFRDLRRKVSALLAVGQMPQDDEARRHIASMFRLMVDRMTPYEGYAED